MNEPTPTNIDVSREQAQVAITWSTGEACTLSFDLLRNSCPCAQCRGGHEHMKSEPDAEMLIIPLMPVTATQMRNLEAVGNYAVSITWADGHSHGIYTWHYLYSLCKMAEGE
ncbi:MAG: DUF971 domain-containing protein [Anaerolineales bacterium]|nr:DUF971 domain-containing protein [Anaerolineales bacterium]